MAENRRLPLVLGGSKMSMLIARREHPARRVTLSGATKMNDEIEKVVSVQQDEKTAEYQPPTVESVMTPEDLSREVQYAGRGGRDAPHRLICQRNRESL